MNYSDELEVVGRVVSPSQVDEFTFALNENKEIRAREYCLVKHPIEDILCLCRVITGSVQNPTVSPKGIGAVIAKSGFEIGKEQEVALMKAEVLGYIKEGKFRPPDFPIAPNSRVYRCSEEQIRPFLQAQEGIQIHVGKDPFSNLPISLSLDWITKGHLGVYGQTRSGKTSFVLRLIKSAVDNDPPARFVIYDRYGEYSPLIDAGYGVRLGYDAFLTGAVSPEEIALRLGLDPKSSAYRDVKTAIETLMDRGTEVTPEAIIEELEEIKMRSDVKARVEYILKSPRAKKELKVLSQEEKEEANLITLIKENPVVIIDFSVDADIGRQQIAFSHIVGRLFSRAVATRGEEFTCINVIEEAQFFAPERGMPTYGDPWGNGSITTLSMGVSQLGGYNIGFIVMTQRPAYVAKAVLAQCNTHICFRLMSSADHDQVSGVTGYSIWRLREILPNLETHIGFLIGAASPFWFPVFCETELWEYPRKATKTASQLLKEMCERM